MKIDNQAVLDRFSGMIRFATVSNPDPEKMDYEEFYKFHRYLEETFPLIHQHLEKEVVSRASLLYRWKGDGSSNRLPIALIAHQDVVPVGEESQWEHGPFSGDIDDTYIWGRGTLDTKCQISAQMEAVEHLLAEGYTPPCDVYLCYGHNEEVMGAGISGAKEIVKLLESRGVRLGCVIDEGGAVVNGTMFGIPQNIATVGLAEKGHADFELSVTDAGGHSSAPGKGTALGKICRAGAAIEANPFPQRLIDVVAGTVAAIGPAMGPQVAAMAADPKTYAGQILAVLDQAPTTAAMTRTTMALTMASGSAQSNILPERATLTVNCRLLPGDTLESVKAHIQSVVGPEITVTLVKGNDPSPESPSDSPEFALLKEVTMEKFPGAIFAPYLMVGGSDSRNYYPICDNVFRFAPFVADDATLPTTHSVNERMLKDGFATAVEFYVEIIRRYGSC